MIGKLNNSNNNMIDNIYYVIFKQEFEEINKNNNFQDFYHRRLKLNKANKVRLF